MASGVPSAILASALLNPAVTVLRELAAPGRVLVVSTHDNRVTRLADRVIEMTPRGADPVRPEPIKVSLRPGEVLFTQGDRSDYVYLVDTGSVELFRERENGAEELITVIHAGQYFGELGPLLGTPRSASSRAAAPTRLTGYPIHEFSRRFPNFQREVHVERL